MRLYVPRVGELVGNAVGIKVGLKVGVEEGLLETDKTQYIKHQGILETHRVGDEVGCEVSKQISVTAYLLPIGSKIASKPVVDWPFRNFGKPLRRRRLRPQPNSKTWKRMLI